MSSVCVQRRNVGFGSLNSGRELKFGNWSIAWNHVVDFLSHHGPLLLIQNQLEVSLLNDLTSVEKITSGDTILKFQIWHFWKRKIPNSTSSKRAATTCLCIVGYWTSRYCISKWWKTSTLTAPTWLFFIVTWVNDGYALSFVDKRSWCDNDAHGGLLRFALFFALFPMSRLLQLWKAMRCYSGW